LSLPPHFLPQFFIGYPSQKDVRVHEFKVRDKDISHELYYGRVRPIDAQEKESLNLKLSRIPSRQEILFGQVRGIFFLDFRFQRYHSARTFLQIINQQNSLTF
jgi:hypothetical protein